MLPGNRFRGECLIRFLRADIAQVELLLFKVFLVFVYWINIDSVAWRRTRSPHDSTRTYSRALEQRSDQAEYNTTRPVMSGELALRCREEKENEEEEEEESPTWRPRLVFEEAVDSSARERDRRRDQTL